MTLEAVKTYVEAGGGILLLLLTVVQIVPIKLNPWSAIGKAVGNLLFKGISEQIAEQAKKIDAIDHKVGRLEVEREKDKADNTRTKILRFADEIRRGVKHSEEYFNQMLDDISWYDNYCASHPTYKNRRAEAAIDLITKTHRDCFDKDSFL